MHKNFHFPYTLSCPSSRETKTNQDSWYCFCSYLYILKQGHVWWPNQKGDLGWGKPSYWYLMTSWDIRHKSWSWSSQSCWPWLHLQWLTWDQVRHGHQSNRFKYFSTPAITMTNSTSTLAFMPLWVLSDRKKVQMKEGDSQRHIRGKEKYQWKEKVMAFVWSHQWYVLLIRLKEKVNKYKHKDWGYFQISWLLSFYEAGSFIAEIQSHLWWPIFQQWGVHNITEGLTEQVLYHVSRIFFSVNMGSCMESNCLYIHIREYNNFWNATREKRNLSMHLKIATCGLERILIVMPLLNDALWSWDEERL